MVYHITLQSLIAVCRFVRTRRLGGSSTPYLDCQLRSDGLPIHETKVRASLLFENPETATVAAEGICKKTQYNVYPSSLTSVWVVLTCSVLRKATMAWPSPSSATQQRSSLLRNQQSRPPHSLEGSIPLSDLGMQCHSRDLNSPITFALTCTFSQDLQRSLSRSRSRNHQRITDRSLVPSFIRGENRGSLALIVCWPSIRFLHAGPFLLVGPRQSNDRSYGKNGSYLRASFHPTTCRMSQTYLEHAVSYQPRVQDN